MIKDRDFFVRVDTDDEGNPEDVAFIRELPDDAAFLICMPASIPPLLSDNALGLCSGCGRSIQFRPIADAVRVKVCVDCAPAWIVGNAKPQ